MTLILFQLFKNLTIGSIVLFRNQFYRIEHVYLITPFNRGSILKTTWKQPAYFVVVIRNVNGGIQIVNATKIKAPYDASEDYEFPISYNDVPKEL